VKVLETTDLDFNRYGDTLFEVLFTGGRVVAGGEKAATESKSRVDYNALSVGTEKEAIKPFVKQFAVILRRRPFLVKNLEAVLKQVHGQPHATRPRAAAALRLSTHHAAARSNPNQSNRFTAVREPRPTTAPCLLAAFPPQRRGMG